jgi:DNA-binding MarR family transcriptional regulator
MVEFLARVYWFDDALQSSLKANGWVQLSRAQSFVLANLAAGVERPSQLARNIGVSHQAMSQTLAEMAARGLVTLSADASDRRATVVKLSPNANPIRKDAVQALQAIEAALGARIGTRRLKALHDAMMMEWGPPPIKNA